MEWAYRTRRPIKFELYRVPFLLEHEYDESEQFQETYKERLTRNLKCYDNDAYCICKWLYPYF